MIFVSQDNESIQARCKTCGEVNLININNCKKLNKGYLILKKIHCNNCGKPKKAIDIMNNLLNNDSIKCPICKSAQLSPNKQGFKIGKAVVGGVLLGGVGLLGGLIGSNKIEITCLSCGHKWEAGKY